MFARCLISVFLIYGASFGQQQNGSASESWKQHMDLAKQLAARGQYADAKSEYEAALRAVSELPNDGRAFLSRLGLGSVAAATGQYTEAEQWDNEAVREGIELYGKDAPGLAIPYGNLAGLYRDQEDYARAEEFARLAVRLISRQQPPVPAAEAELLGSLGGILSARGNFDEAESVLQQSIGIAEELPGSSDILAAGWSNLAGVYTRTGRMKEALALYERARDVYNGAGDRNNPNLFFILSGIASIEGASGSYTLAVDSIESAIQRAEAGGSADTLQVRNALLAEATWLHKLKRDKEAKRVLAKARQVARAASHHSYGQYTVDAREVAQTMVDRAK